MEKVGGGVTTSYVYDGMDILRESRGGTISMYIHGPAIDEPLAKDNGGALTYFHVDGLGSVMKATDQAGAVTSAIRYDTWGNIDAGTPDVYAFTGREWDAEAGLYYYRARYYDPKSGRFIGEDPIGFGGGANFYDYALGNPARYTDPFGLEVWPEHVPDRPVGLIDIAAEWRNYSMWAEANRQALAVEHPDVSRLLDFADWYMERTGGVGIMPVAGMCAAPTNLAEQLTLEEAMGGAGERIMQGKIKDLRYPEDVFAKMQHVHEHPELLDAQGKLLQEGTNTVVHYWQDLITGIREGFKFK